MKKSMDRPLSLVSSTLKLKALSLIRNCTFLPANQKKKLTKRHSSTSSETEDRGKAAFSNSREKMGTNEEMFLAVWRLPEPGEKTAWPENSDSS